MPALTTREEARARVLKMFEASLNRIIPLDSSKPLQGEVFADFERQTYAATNDVVAAVMEERAKLDVRASVTEAGPCPHCGSARTYLEKQQSQQEVRSPSGALMIVRQHARCRACDGSFSPSAQRLGAAHRSAADTQGAVARQPRVRGGQLRLCRRSTE
jgi:hypothetical protein